MEVAHDLAGLLGQRVGIGNGAGAEAVEETLAPLAERDRAIGDRDVVARQQHVELHLPRNQRATGVLENRFEPLTGVEAGLALGVHLPQPVFEAVIRGGAQRPRQGAMSLGKVSERP